MDRVLNEDELQDIIGGNGELEFLKNLYDFGKKIGEIAAHAPSGSGVLPMCYDYPPSYPAPVLPCRH